MTCDPYWSDVVLLLHFDGANGATTTTDSSSYANTINFGGGTALETSQVLYGTASLSVPGPNAFYSPEGVYTNHYAPGSALDILRLTDWTIEFAVNMPANGITAFEYGTDGFNPGVPAANPTGQMPIYISVSSGTMTITVADYSAFGTGGQFSGSLSYTAGTWVQVAVVKNGDGTNIVVYANGVSVGSGGFNWLSYNYTNGGGANCVCIGPINASYNPGNYAAAYFDEVRVTSGVARYTANYTPASAAFPSTTCTATVPNVVGDTLSVATTAVIAAGLVVGTVTYTSSGTPNEVYSQSPTAGTGVSTGSAVNLVITYPPIPNVVGDTLAAATAALTAVSLTVGTVTYTSSGTVGTVYSQSPAAGGVATPGNTENLVITYCTVPNVVGDTQAVATSAITGALLTLGMVSSAVNAVTAGNVISQSPTAGVLEPPGTPVNISVSLGPNPSGTVYLQAKFVPATVGAAIMTANPGNIHPRITPPERDTTVRINPSWRSL